MKNTGTSTRASGIPAWLLTGGALLLSVSGLWLYLQYTRVELDRRIAETEARYTTESTRAPFTTLEAYDLAEQRGDLQTQREMLAGILPLGPLFRPAQTGQPAATGSEAWRKAHDMTMELRGRAEVAEAAAAEARFKDPDLNIEAMRAIGEWRVQVGREKLAAAGD